MSSLACPPTIAAAVLVLLSVPAKTKLVYVEENLPLQNHDHPPGSPWPWPLNISPEQQQVTLDPFNFTITSNLKGCTVIDAALHRYHTLTLLERPPAPHGLDIEMERQARADPGLDVLYNLHVHILSECDERPSLSQDKDYESYKLAVEMNNGTASARLESKTVWGALRGLETFSQLVYIEEPMNYFRLNLTLVEDSPRFAHRGLLLDTARHFIPKHVLLQVLDSMSWNKLNVFHWHIVDDQSFPYESKLFKNLSELGAFTPRHVYTQEDVEDILEYASLRGIRVIPEFDTPGHTQGFGKAFPHLLTPCYGIAGTPGTPNYPYHAAFENFDPTNQAVYDFMRSFLVDIKNTFTDYIHLGLDEVFLPCWQSSPKVQEFMKQHNYTETREVEQHYVKQILHYSKETNKPWITWQDPAERGIQMENDSIVQIWKDVSLSPTKMKGWRQYVNDLTANGYKVILSSCWYINFITYGQDWKNFYNCDPTDFSGNATQKKLVLGGEAAMWGEYVDATNLMPRLWPRASAAAERLWSKPLDQSEKADDAASRLDQHRCRMLRRGISAQPILNGFCGEWEVPLHVWPPMSTTTTTTTTTPTPPTSPTTTPPTPPTTTSPTTPSTTPPTTETGQNETASTPKTQPVVDSPVAVVKNDTSDNSSSDSEIVIDESSTAVSSSTVPTITTSTTTVTSTSTLTTANATTIPTTTEQGEIEPSVSPDSSVSPVSDVNSSMSDDTVSVPPIESIEAISAAAKYIESTEDSNVIEDQSDSTGTA